MIIEILIDEKLQALGITKNYKGYHKLKLAVKFALEDEFKLYSISKELYEPIAEKCDCSVASIYRNIKTITDNIWINNYNNLGMLAGYKLSNKPTASELIAILVADIQRSQTLSAG